MKLDDEIREAWSLRRDPKEARNWWLERTRFSQGYRACYERHVEPPKVVDLSVVAGSNIPMLFRDKDKPVEGFLWRYEPDETFPFKTRDNGFLRCWFDTTRPVAWLGGECPLPEGVMCKVSLRRSTTSKWTTVQNATDWSWNYAMSDENSQIIAFQVTGLAPGWRYPWE